MGMTQKLQNAWGGERDLYESTDTLARWAIEKETKLTMIQNLQKGRETEHKDTSTPKNPNETCQAALTTQHGGDPMELDATRREPNLNLFAQEFRWGRNTKPCLKCTRIGHMIKEWKNTKDSRGHTALWKVRKPPTNTRYNPVSKIREMESDKDLSAQDESETDEDSQ